MPRFSRSGYRPKTAPSLRLVRRSSVAPHERVTAPGGVCAATWTGFVLMCLGMFMAILDIQVVATTLPSIQDALEVAREAVSWIQTAYLIAEVTPSPLADQ